MLVYEWTVYVNGGRGVAAASGADHVDELQLFYGASNLPVVIPTDSTSICYWRWLHRPSFPWKKLRIELDSSGESIMNPNRIVLSLSQVFFNCWMVIGYY
jgi:hypothetical protein